MVNMARSLALTAVLLFAGCEASIGGAGNGLGGGDDMPEVDAGGSNTIEPDAPVTPTPDAAPACFNGRVVYLNFGGVTLTRAPSNAVTNAASWIGRTDGRTSATVPPYRQGAANRQQLIDAVVANVRAGLAQFPVTVVTDRPASGEYVMVAFGGTRDLLGTPYSIATNELDCGDARRNDVAWVSDTTVDAKVDDYALGAIGFGLGLTGTTATTDCMCGWGNDCQQGNATQCTLTDATLARDPTAEQLCPGVTTQNANTAFTAAFCN